MDAMPLLDDLAGVEPCAGVEFEQVAVGGEVAGDGGVDPLAHLGEMGMVLAKAVINGRLAVKCGGDGGSMFFIG